MVVINRSILGIIVVLSLCCGNCKPKYRQQDKPVVPAVPDQESILRSNQLIIKHIAESIRNQAVIRSWKLTETGTGLFYQVLHHQKRTNSRNIESGDWVSLKYKISLLDGTVCYSSDNLGPKQFFVEKSEAVAGLHEAIQQMYPGDSALIVIPPQKAYGLAGDGNLIPPGAILVYEIRIDSVARHQTD